MRIGIFRQATQVFEHLAPRLEHGADAGVQRQPAEIRTPGHGDAAKAARQIRGENLRLRGHASGITRILTRQCSQQEGSIGDAARHRSFDRKPQKRQRSRRGWHQPDAGSKSDYIVEGGRISQ